MIKYYYPDGSHCYRALHTTHAVYTDDSELYEFEILGFELVPTGVRCS
jgi:hypothetical protein